MPHPTTVFVRPAQGIRIADPQTGQYLPEQGLLVPRSGFWLRRLKDGDVIAVESTIQSAVNAANPGTTLVEPAQDARAALSRAEQRGVSASSGQSDEPELASGGPSNPAQPAVATASVRTGRADRASSKGA